LPRGRQCGKFALLLLLLNHSSKQRLPGNHPAAFFCWGKAIGEARVARSAVNCHWLNYLR
jgi:hypothetical protein